MKSWISFSEYEEAVTDRLSAELFGFYACYQLLNNFVWNRKMSDKNDRTLHAYLRMDTPEWYKYTYNS